MFKRISGGRGIAPPRGSAAVLAVILIGACVTSGAGYADPISGTVSGIDTTQHTITIALPRTLKLQPSDSVAIGVLAKLVPGERATVTTQPDGATIATLAKTTAAVDRWHRIVALVIGLCVVLLAGALASRWAPRKLILGEDMRYSNSKTQLAVWATTLFAVYIAALILRWWEPHEALIGGIGIPDNLALLSGISALTYAGAKAITTGKVDDAAAKNAQDIAQGRPPQAPTKDPAAQPNILTDLFQDDQGNVDIGDVQMIFVTLLAVAVYWLQCAVFFGHLDIGAHMDLPDVDTTMLAGVGVGQGAYLAKKAASTLGHG